MALQNMHHHTKVSPTNIRKTFSREAIMKTSIQSSQQRHLQEPGWNGVLFDNAPVVTNKTQPKKKHAFTRNMILRSVERMQHRGEIKCKHK